MQFTKIQARNMVVKSSREFLGAKHACLSNRSVVVATDLSKVKKLLVCFIENKVAFGFGPL